MFNSIRSYHDDSKIIINDASVVLDCPINYFDGVSREIGNFVKSCPDCQKAMQLTREPLIQPPLPTYPWEKVASDLFEFNKNIYILVVNYFKIH